MINSAMFAYQTSSYQMLSFPIQISSLMIDNTVNTLRAGECSRQVRLVNLDSAGAPG
jgi:hypothetical protein